MEKSINWFKLQLFKQKKDDTKSYEVLLKVPLFLYILPIIASFILIFVNVSQLPSYDFGWKFSWNFIPFGIDILSSTLFLSQIPSFVKFIFKKLFKKQINHNLYENKTATKASITIQKMVYLLPFIYLTYCCMGLFFSLFSLLVVHIISFFLHIFMFVFLFKFKEKLSINLGSLEKPSKISIFSLIFIPLAFIFSFLELEVLNLVFYCIILIYLIIIVLYPELKRIDMYIGLAVIVIGIGFLRIFYGSLLIGRTDIHNEIFVANLTIKNSGWFPSASENTYNSVLSITILPFLVFLLYNITPICYYGFINPILYAFFIIITYKTVCDTVISKKGEKKKKRNETLIFVLILIVALIRTGTNQIFSNNRSLIALSLFAILIAKTYPSIIKKSRKQIYQNYKSELAYQFMMWITLIISHWGTAIIAFIYLISYYIFLLIKISKENRKVLIVVLSTLVTTISFAILWYSKAPLIQELIGKIFKNILDFSKNPSFKNLIVGNELFQNLLFLNKEIECTIFFEAILSLISIFLPILSLMIAYIYFQRRKKSESSSKNEFRFLFILTISYYLVNSLFLLTPGTHELYGANRVYFQGLFFFVYICSYGFSLLDGHIIKFKNKNIIRFNSKRSLSLFLILIFLIHQGILIKFISLSSTSEENWRGNLIFDKNTIEFSRWYISDEDIEIYEWIESNRTNDFVMSELTRLYQLYTYSGIIFTPELIYKSDIRILLNENSTEIIPIGGLVYIPYSSVICGRLYFSDDIMDFIDTNQLIQILINLELSLVYQNGAMLFQKI
ncbi:MAG: hypothetical protein ACTSP3_03015 [Candidatus Heimdallarchaeaceae archaeon]